jgi:hypothetical protein
MRRTEGTMKTKTTKKSSKKQVVVEQELTGVELEHELITQRLERGEITEGQAYAMAKAIGAL